MAGVNLTPALREEYEGLFQSCTVSPEHEMTAQSLAGRIVEKRARYESVATQLTIPWYFVGIVHSMEASLNFGTHMHNGDPLTARTVHEPRNRPVSGSPPFTWEESAEDALRLEKLDQWQDWSLAGTLYQLERYNGFGYRTEHPEVLTPYLWSFSNHYTKGKFVADHKFDPDAVSKQCGAAVLLSQIARDLHLKFEIN
jgi:lysozyme family protein